MTDAVPTEAASLALDSKARRSILDTRVRDWVTKAFGIATFFLLLLVTMHRIGGVLRQANEGLDALTATRLLTVLCQAGFYGLIITFTLLRSAPLRRASGWQPRLSAMLGTFLFLGFAFLPPARLPLVWQIIAAGLIAVSAVLLLIVLPRLGRSFSLMAEARQLVMHGPYRIIRHPLYAVEEIGMIGAFIAVISVPAALLLVAQIAFQIRRIYNEEAVLEATFPHYAAYKASTARLIPGVW